ncbi:MAG: chorismate synthase [Pseudobutyrivibrio sp.]|nr:chorismate synthase [Pseudobutyrivibrio sp.]
MSGSSFGKNITVTTWGESHGKALGVVIDGIPAGLELNESDIQKYLDRRKPGQSKYTTSRAEGDDVEILSGVFEGKTTGCPISLMVRNKDQHSNDYGNIATTFRPGHADYTFWEKYGLRDYRGGGRSSGRETIGRVAAGAVCSKLLNELGVNLIAYTKSIGPVSINNFELEECLNNKLYMPDKNAAVEAEAYLNTCIKNQDSAGGIIECVIKGLPAGLGDPVFDKLDATLAHAMLSIGAVKGFEMGDGFNVATATGSMNNDNFTIENSKIIKTTNHSGGVLGGISDGSDLVFRVAVKPTPSISQPQATVNEAGENVDIIIHGRHDPVVVPRAVVVVECMAAITVLDALMAHMTDRLSFIKEFYN